MDSTPDDALPIPRDENSEARHLKLSNFMNELKIHDGTDTPQNIHDLICVFDRCLDAVAKDNDDFAHSSGAEHTITMGDAHPIKEKLLPIPHHRRSFADRELDRYLRHGIVSKSDTGKCPCAGAINIVIKKETELAMIIEALPMCHDYRNVKFITINDAYPLSYSNTSRQS